MQPEPAFLPLGQTVRPRSLYTLAGGEKAANRRWKDSRPPGAAQRSTAPPTDTLSCREEMKRSHKPPQRQETPHSPPLSSALLTLLSSPPLPLHSPLLLSSAVHHAIASARLPLDQPAALHTPLSKSTPPPSLSPSPHPLFYPPPISVSLPLSPFSLSLSLSPL